MKSAAPGSFQLENVLPDPRTKLYFVGGGLWGQANTLWPVKSLFPAPDLVCPHFPSDAFRHTTCQAGLSS